MRRPQKFNQSSTFLDITYHRQNKLENWFKFFVSFSAYVSKLNFFVSFSKQVKPYLVESKTIKISALSFWINFEMNEVLKEYLKINDKFQLHQERNYRDSPRSTVSISIVPSLVWFTVLFMRILIHFATFHS